jgi:hypothetical protein
VHADRENMLQVFQKKNCINPNLPENTMFNIKKYYFFNFPSQIYNLLYSGVISKFVVS